MRAAVLVALVAVVAIVSAHTVASVVVEEDPVYEKFVMYMNKFGKSYLSLEEHALRFNNFKASLKRVEQRNSRQLAETGEMTGVFGLTKFSDMSVEEFKSTMLGYRPSAERRQMAVTPAPQNVAAPQKLDWRQKGAVTPVKDQGQCGSCWAFSTTEEIESRWFQAGNKLTELSVQQIVSCDTVDGGCNGGDTTTAYKYVEQAGGLESEDTYPYASGGGDSGSCNFDQGSIVASIKNFTYATSPCYDDCNAQNETDLAVNMAATGPVSICVYAESWMDYDSGVLTSDCPHGYSDLDHCVQLVGYDMTASTPYWIVRNSWNTDWGIDGYIHIAIKKNLCGVADEATFAWV